MNKKSLVILLNFNNWQDTVECIESMYQTDFRDILVVDNGSTDESVSEIRKRYPDVVLLDTGKNLGFTGGNNLGIEYGVKEGYKYVILLNNDTIVSKNAIQIITEKMDAHPETAIGTGQIRWFPDEEKIWYAGGKLINWRGLAVHKGFGKKYTELEPQQDEDTEFISGCYMCIRASDLEKLGLLKDDFFIYLEDIEYSARAVRNGKKLSYFPDSLIYHKWRGETVLGRRTLYYVVRNRLLLIDLAFPPIAGIYFKMVINLKMIYWYFRNKALFEAASKGMIDYKKKYFGPIHF